VTTPVRLDHAAVWTTDIERLRDFYVRWFGATAGARYANPRKAFESYFLTFPGGGARLELMAVPDLAPNAASPVPRAGYAHIALAVGSEAAVDALAESLRNAGLTVADGPRRTGDGYYECVVLDPDGNRVEITV
jgi:lactoylglutathione lyase